MHLHSLSLLAFVAIMRDRLHEREAQLHGDALLCGLACFKGGFDFFNDLIVFESNNVFVADFQDAAGGCHACLTSWGIWIIEFQKENINYIRCILSLSFTGFL